MTKKHIIITIVILLLAAAVAWFMLVDRSNKNDGEPGVLEQISNTINDDSDEVIVNEDGSIETPILEFDDDEDGASSSSGDKKKDDGNNKKPGQKPGKKPGGSSDDGGDSGDSGSSHKPVKNELPEDKLN